MFCIWEWPNFGPKFACRTSLSPKQSNYVPKHDTATGPSCLHIEVIFKAGPTVVILWHRKCQFRNSLITLGQVGTPESTSKSKNAQDWRLDFQQL